MATILQLKENHNDQIRTRNTASSILRTEHADIEDALANELRDRGVIQAATTGDLASISKDNTKLVVVKNVGGFWSLETVASPNGSTTFASADAGFLWEKIMPVSVAPNDPEAVAVDNDYDYELDAGLMVDIIMIKPTAADTVAISLTVGDNAVLMPTLLTVGDWNVVSRIITTNGSPVTIRFTGINADATIVFYKRNIPT